MKKFISLLLVAMLLVPSAAFAEGFGLYEWSAAGSAMSQNYMFGENDPSVLAYNPAQITKIRGSYFQAGFSFVNPNIGLDYFKSGSQIGSGTTNYNPATVPSFYYVQDSKGSNFWWGIGAFARYGNAMDLDRRGPGRFDTIYAGVTSFTVQPTIAFKPHKKWSVALALDLNYAALKTKKGMYKADYNLDMGTLEIEGSTCNVGYVLSAMYDFNEKTSIAAVYRSRIHQQMKDADADVPDAYNGVPIHTKACGAVTLPDSITLGIGHKFNDRTRIEANAVWTNWATYDKLDLVFDDPLFGMVSTKTITNNWKAAWKLGLGVEHKLSNQWTVLAGYTWDQSPVPNDFVNLNLPTGNRHYLSAGFKYSPNPIMTFAFGYTYVIMGDRLITGHADENPNFDYVKAHNESSHNVFLSLTVKCR